jgi:RNA polymerase sigma factor (sigma-70 family)
VNLTESATPAAVLTDAPRDDAEASQPTVEAVFRHLAGPVHAYLRAAGAVDSEDLLGEVFCDVTRGLGRFRGDERALRRWVFTIAHHRLVDERRRLAQRRRFLRAHPLPVAEAPGEPFDPRLVDALGALTADQREVVVLRFVADLPLETVAELTRRPVGAVKSLQHRALRQLAEMLRG